MYCLESSYKKATSGHALSQRFKNKNDNRLKIKKIKKKINPQSFLYTYLDLAGAEMTASTAVGSKAIAAKVVHLDPTSFKSLYSLYFN